MKTKLLAALFGAGMLYAAPALADGQGEHPNGTVQASMMSNGNVQMMVTIPDQEFQAIGHAMKSGNVDCTAKEMFPGSADTIIFDCNNVQPVGG
jgi:hypothetical protein